MENIVRIDNFKNSPYYMELGRERYESIFWQECSWEFRCHFWVKDKITNREICHIIINEKDCMNLLGSLYNYINFNSPEIVIPFQGCTTNPDIFMFQFYINRLSYENDDFNHLELNTTEYFVIKKYNSIEQITVDLVKFDFVDYYKDEAINLPQFCSYIFDTFLYDIVDAPSYDPSWLL